jgi:hypothetical protein
MDMTVVSGPHAPLWLRITFLAIVIWPFLGPAVIRRHADLRAFSLVPLFVGTAAASLGAVRIIFILNLSGKAPHAAAAGAAEALIAPIFGAVFSTGIASMIAILPRFAEARRQRGLRVEVLMIFFIITFALFLALIQSIRMSGMYTSGLNLFSKIVCAANVLVAVAALVFAFFSEQRLFRSSGRAWFGGLAVASAGVVVLLVEFQNHLRHFAISGA